MYSFINHVIDKYHSLCKLLNVIYIKYPRNLVHHYKCKMEIIQNNKGHQKLCYQGYSYTKKRSTKSTVHWVCSEKTASQCHGILITDLAVSTSNIIKVVICVLRDKKFNCFLYFPYIVSFGTVIDDYLLEMPV